MKIKSNLWFIDNHNGNIYYFEKIGENFINGFAFKRATKSFIKGTWDKIDWRTFFKEKNRIVAFEVNTTTPRRRHSMVESIFKWRPF